MKRLAIFSRKDVIIAAVILIAGALTLGLPSICSSVADGPVGSESSYVNIPILNNHYPQTATITKMHVSAPVACSYTISGSSGKKGGGSIRWYNVKKVKKIRLGGTVVFSTDFGECCCIGDNSSPFTHSHGQTYTFNDNGNAYGFSGPKVTCKITLDVGQAPSGLYTIVYTYRLPEDTEDRESQLTFNLP